MSDTADDVCLALDPVHASVGYCGAGKGPRAFWKDVTCRGCVQGRLDALYMLFWSQHSANFVAAMNRMGVKVSKGLPGIP